MFEYNKEYSKKEIFLGLTTNNFTYKSSGSSIRITTQSTYFDFNRIENGMYLLHSIKARD